jgi:hypothetical protein
LLEKPDCATCRKIKGDAFCPSDCIKCLPPLLDENIDAARVYCVTQGQLIMGMAGAVDINHLAIHEAMRLYEVEDKPRCFEKVLRLAGHFLEKARQERD